MAGPPDADDPASPAVDPCHLAAEAGCAEADDSTSTMRTAASAESNNKRATWRDLPEKSSADSATAAPASSDSSSGSSSVAADTPSAPNGGYGWVVCGAAFFVNLIADGITFSFGVLFVEFVHYFGAGKSSTSWIGSLFMAMPLLCGPIASFLTDRYGCRKVTMVGGVLAAVGFGLSSLSENMIQLSITFGVIAGLGLALCYVAAVVIVAFYFDTRRSLATGLSQCGSGIGTMIFPPIIHCLIGKYGWRGTTLLLSGIFLNLTVCGALMREIEWWPRRRKSASTKSIKSSTEAPESPHRPADELHQLLEEQGEDPSRLCSSLVALPTFVKSGERVPLEALERLSAHRPMYDVLVKNYPSLLISHSLSSDGDKGVGALHLNSPVDRTLAGTPPPSSLDVAHHHNQHPKKLQSAFLKDLRVHRHSLTYRGAMLNINRYRLRASSCPDIYRNSMTTISEEKEGWYAGLSELKSVMLDILDLSYFLDTRFALFALSNFFLYMWYDVPYVYLADFAIEHGYSSEWASYLISIIGIANIFGEVALGWAGDKAWVNAGLLYAVCMVLCGAMTAALPFFPTNYIALSIFSAFFGLFIGANYALSSIILVELITLERFTNAYGLLLLVQGVANLIGPPLAGYLYDLTGKYNLSFYLGGFFISMSGVLLLILPLVERLKRRNDSTDTSPTMAASSGSNISSTINRSNSTQFIQLETEEQVSRAVQV